MSDSMRLSHRAIAASAAFLLTGAAFAGPAVAGDDGKGGKGGGDRGASSSQGRSQGSSQGSSQGRSGGSQGQGEARSAEARSGTKGSGGAKGTDNGDPAGNNGTFKVDGLPYSDGMANEPHVACGFRLKFFGFDDDQTGDITIAGQAPSGSGVVSSLTGVTISDDAAGGGPNDPDAIFEYTAADLDLAGLTAHPQQGYHLKVTLTTDAPGGVKHKVFWFEPCETGTETGGTGGTDTGTGGTDTGTGGTDTGVGGTDTGTGGVTPPTVGAVGGTSEDRTAVLGTKFTRSTATAAVTANRGATAVLGTRFTRGPGALPFTGSLTSMLLTIGGALVFIGAGAWALGRRLRHTA